MMLGPHVRYVLGLKRVRSPHFICAWSQTCSLTSFPFCLLLLTNHRILLPWANQPLVLRDWITHLRSPGLHPFHSLRSPLHSLHSQADDGTWTLRGPIRVGATPSDGTWTHPRAQGVRIDTKLQRSHVNAGRPPVAYATDNLIVPDRGGKISLATNMKLQARSYRNTFESNVPARISMDLLSDSALHTLVANVPATTNISPGAYFHEELWDRARGGTADLASTLGREGLDGRRCRGDGRSARPWTAAGSFGGGRARAGTASSSHRSSSSAGGRGERGLSRSGEGSIGGVQGAGLDGRRRPGTTGGGNTRRVQLGRVPVRRLSMMKRNVEATETMLKTLQIRRDSRGSVGSSKSSAARSSMTRSGRGSVTPGRRDSRFSASDPSSGGGDCV